MNKGLLFALGLFLSAHPALATPNVFGLSCANLSCGVNYVPNTETASSITIMGTGMNAWVNNSLVIGLSQGTSAVGNLGTTLQPDGTMYTVLDLSTLRPGNYSFVLSPANARGTVLGSGTFTVIGAQAAQPAPQSNGLVGNWISMGMLVPTPLVISANGTYRFGNNAGSYRPTPTGGVFTGMFAGMNGGQGVLGNGTLHFQAPGAAAGNMAYTFRRQ